MTKQLRIVYLIIILDVQFKDWKEPKWSKILRDEIAEGRLYMKCNQDLLKEESAYYILDILGWEPYQGAYASFVKFLMSIKTYKVLFDSTSKSPWVC